MRPVGAPRGGGTYSGLSSGSCAASGAARHRQVRPAIRWNPFMVDPPPLVHTIDAHGLAAPLEHESSDALAALIHRQQHARLLAEQDAADLALVALRQRERLQPRRDVDGVADHRVLEALPAAD